MTTDISRDIEKMEDKCNQCRTEIGAKITTQVSEMQLMREKLIVLETKWEIKDKDVAALKKVIIEGNGVPSLKEQVRTLTTQREDDRREMNRLKELIEEGARRDEERKKDTRNARISLYVALISAIGTIAAGSFIVFAPK